MKTCIPLLVGLSLCLLGFLPGLAGQKFDLNEVKADGTAIFELTLPALTAKQGYETKNPYYKRLFVHGDGSFRMDTSSAWISELSRRYGPASGGLGAYYARAYANGVYSGTGDEPPKLEAPPALPPVDVAASEPTLVVDDGRYLKITRNVEVLPGDPFVNIISVRNIDPEVPLRGKIFLFYNGLLRELPLLQKAKNEVGGLNFTEPEGEYSQFSIERILNYRPRISQNTSIFFAGVPAFERVVVLDVSSLPPGDEMHFFVEMTGDESMMDQFDSKAKAQMDFLAVLATTAGQQSYLYPKAISTEEEAALTAQGITAHLPALDTLTGDSAFLFIPQENTGETIQDEGLELNFLANRILDVYRSTATLVNVHDPNFLLLESCACPARPGRYQILATIQCENEGFAETDEVYIDLKLPSPLQTAAVVDEPLSYHPPQMDPTMVRFDSLAPDSIRWTFVNLGLQGTPAYGVGDPRTYAQVQFHLYSDVPPAELPSMEACIRFKYQGDTLAPICTEAVKVDLLGAAEAPASLLSCAEKSCATDAIQQHKEGWPCWVHWLLVIIVLLLLAFWIIRRR